MANKNNRSLSIYQLNISSTNKSYEAHGWSAMGTNPESLITSKNIEKEFPLTSPSLLISGEWASSERSDFPNSCIVITPLSLVFPQSELYPKLCIRTFLNSGSLGSHSFGQKCSGFLVLLQVFLEPPRRPWTNIKSTSGADGIWSRLRPSGPIASSEVSRDCSRVDRPVNLRSRVLRSSVELLDLRRRENYVQPPVLINRISSPQSRMKDSP